MTATMTPKRFWRPKAPAGQGVPADLLMAARAWLAVLGLLAIVIGGHDLLVATEISVRLWGTLVFGAGAVLVAGAAALNRPTPRGRALATVAALLGIALGVMTFLVQVVSDEPDVRLLIWGSIIALSAGTAWIVREATPDEERGIGVWKHLPILKSVVSVGVLISLAQFWYTAIYVPTTAPANLTLEPKLTQSAQGDRVVLQGTVTMRNTSGTRVMVLASYLDVMAMEAGMAPDDDAAFADQVTRSHDLAAGQPVADRYVMRGPAKSVLHGSAIEDGTYFEPGETITRNFLTWVPKDKYTFVSATVFITIARGRALALGPENEPAPSRGGSTVSIQPVPESGWLRSLTRGSRYLRIDYDDHDLSQAPQVRITPSRDRAPEDFNERMLRFYGASTVDAATFIAIPPKGAAEPESGAG